MFSTGLSVPLTLLLLCPCLTELEALLAKLFLLFLRTLELTVSLAVVASSDSNFAELLDEQSPAPIDRLQPVDLLNPDDL